MPTIIGKNSAFWQSRVTDRNRSLWLGAAIVAFHDQRARSYGGTNGFTCVFDRVTGKKEGTLHCPQTWLSQTLPLKKN